MLIALNKPYGVLSQFTSAEAKRTLAELVDVRGLYPAGRLDFDSEGLLLLTDDGALQHAIAVPARGLQKRYWAQVEGAPQPAALERLAAGVEVGSGPDRYRAQPVSVTSIPAPAVADRIPPIRRRDRIPTSWLELRISEGKNRQVRRMTAAIGHPTLRLIRVGIGRLDLSALELAPDTWREIDAATIGLATITPSSAHTARGVRPGKSVSTGFRKPRYWG